MLDFNCQGGRLIFIFSDYKFEPAPKTSYITNGCKIQYFRYRIKPFLNAAMAAPVESLPARFVVPSLRYRLWTSTLRDRSVIRCLNLELFAHSHDERVFGAGSSLVGQKACFPMKEEDRKAH